MSTIISHGVLTGANRKFNLTIEQLKKIAIDRINEHHNQQCGVKLNNCWFSTSKNNPMLGCIDKPVEKTDSPIYIEFKNKWKQNCKGFLIGWQYEKVSKKVYPIVLTLDNTNIMSDGYYSSMVDQKSVKRLIEIPLANF